MKLHRKLKAIRYLALACPAVTLAMAGTASADELDKPRYTMSVIADTAYGQKVLAKDYDVAISKLENSERTGLRSFYAATNLCVAYVKSGDLGNAKTSCDRAVYTIKNAIETDWQAKRDSYTAKVYRTYLALALSNRGVAHAMTGSPELARSDFTNAMKIDTDMREPEINLARLSKEDTPSA